MVIFNSRSATLLQLLLLSSTVLLVGGQNSTLLPETEKTENIPTSVVQPTIILKSTLPTITIVKETNNEISTNAPPTSQKTVETSQSASRNDSSTMKEETVEGGTVVSDENGGIHGISTQECSRTKICLRNPSICKDSKSCNIFITSQYDSKRDVVMFEMGTKVDYVALGQNIWNGIEGNNVMVNLRGQYCSRAVAGKSFGSFDGNNLTQNGQPNYNYGVEGVKKISVRVVGGSSVMCRFERAATPPESSKHLLYDLHEGLRVAVSYGPLTGDDLNKHFNKFYTPTRVRFTDHTRYLSSLPFPPFPPLFFF